MEELLNEVIKLLSYKLDKNSIIYISQYGSHLYGLDTPTSDYDFRGVFIPNIDDLILGTAKDEVNIKTEYNGKDLDIKMFSLQKFFRLCSKGDTNALDLLFSIDSTHQYKYINLTEGFEFVKEIRNNTSKLIDTGRLQSPITYAYGQAERYSLKTDHIKLYDMLIELSDRLIIGTVGDLVEHIKVVFGNNLHTTVGKDGKTNFLYVLGNEYDFNLSISTFKEFMELKRNKFSLHSAESNGNDWKALSHAIRILVEVKELLTTGGITFPIKDAELVKSIKAGKIGRPFIDAYFEKELSDVLDLVHKNTLQWEYDKEYWNAFVLKLVKPPVGPVEY